MRVEYKITVNQKAEALLRGGHIWVYGEEIEKTEGEPKNGDIVCVYSKKDRFLGAGFYNAGSKIAVRVLTSNGNDEINDAFFARRVKYAVDLRRTVMGPDFTNTRLIFGDADGLPGLIVDKFGSVLVTQIMTLGMEMRKDAVFTALVDHLRALGEPVTTLYERNDVHVRAKEGLPLGKGYYPAPGLKNDEKTVLITENGITYNVDFINGQKTGFFLDQKYNRLAAAGVAAGRTVLDCFTHTGGFAFNCLTHGAKSVTAADISAEAIERTKENAALNGFQNIDFICADAFDLLDRLLAEKRKLYDYIILDPPAFTKSSKTVNAAYGGYKELNVKADRRAHV